ncbi:hypothetical protein [Costertonia aggregata]|uniref:Uncharacterized protein n=1 Tax=Costertonia aggregata TaxID=343403 RepID=A0A7H9ALF9_9FLAO|nr:hypothetical protein [Costertonia aggregata]QLG44288.1 hypothetical protein HYG79_02660 [Costertonia aggregata]
MHKSIFIVYVMFSIIGFSQPYTIQKIEFKGKGETKNEYIEMLKLKDDNALVIVMGDSKFSTLQDLNCIVYLNNGQVERYELTNVKRKIRVKKKRVSKNGYDRYWKFLNSCIQENRFEFDEKKLSGINEDGSIINIGISGGTTKHFALYQNKDYAEYSSFSPNIFIHGKTYGFEEKQKLLNLIDEFENLRKQ